MSSSLHFLIPHIQESKKSDSPALNRGFNSKKKQFTNLNSPQKRGVCTRVGTCKLWPIPGMYALISMLFDKRTRAYLRNAELGFLYLYVVDV
jgi:hypothetical protein